MDGLQRRFVREILDRNFPDLPIRADEVIVLSYQAHVIDFPRMMFCDCKRCTSSWVVKAVLGMTITIKTETNEYSVYRPDDSGSLEHIW